MRCKAETRLATHRPACSSPAVKAKPWRAAAPAWTESTPPAAKTEIPLASRARPRRNSRLRKKTTKSGRAVFVSAPQTPVLSRQNGHRYDQTASGKSFEFNLRFPGQYADKETNTNYNYFRDYNPTTGRYVQSDPIGTVLYKDMASQNLGPAGLVNNPDLASQIYRQRPEFNQSYTYVKSSPLGYVDPDGLCRRGFKPMEGNPGACVPDDRVDSDKCVTGECSAGVSPAKIDCRPQSKIDQDSCEMICGWLSPGPPLPMSKVSMGKTGGSYLGCKALCMNEKIRRTLIEGR